MDEASTEPRSAPRNSQPIFVRKKGEQWTPEMIAALAEARKKDGTKAAAKEFDITETRLRQLLPKQEPEPKANYPFRQVFRSGKRVA